MTTRYGIISDIHVNPNLVSTAIDILKREGIEKLILNGDIGDKRETPKATQNYMGSVLDLVGKSNLESYIQPGSHEPIWAYEPVVNYFSNKYKNIIDATKNQKVEQKDHHLVFLPGSDFLCDGEYQIGENKKIPSGMYLESDNSLIRIKGLEDYFIALRNNLANKAIYYFNMFDLKHLVTEPDKSIVVCHVPRKFNNLENCVDMAEFGEVRENFLLNNQNIPKGSVFPLIQAIKLYNSGVPIDLKKENRGNESLSRLYEEIGITKSVSGHFHESSHRANDRDGNHLKENEFVEELFWNSGCLDYGECGILSVDGEKVSYKNIKLRDYLI